MMNGEIIFFFNMFHDFFQPGIGKLLHLPAYFTHDMFVFPVIVRTFKLGDIITELVFYNQLTFQQQIYRIVQRGTTDPVIFILHEHVQGFYIKMSGMRINLIQNGVSFGRLAMSLLLQVSGKNLFYRLLYFFH